MPRLPTPSRAAARRLCLLVVAAAAATLPLAAAAAAGAATAVKGSSKHGGHSSKAKCPSSAAACGLATQADLEATQAQLAATQADLKSTQADLAATNALLAYYETTVRAMVRATVGVDGKTCHVSVEYNEPGRPLIHNCFLSPVLDPGALFPTVQLRALCPFGYERMVQSTCLPLIVREADDEVLARGPPIVDSGQIDETGFCGIDLSPLIANKPPEGSVLRITMYIACTRDSLAADAAIAAAGGGNEGGATAVAAALRAAAAAEGASIEKARAALAKLVPAELLPL